jgi:hypothetical protein
MRTYGLSTILLCFSFFASAREGSKTVLSGLYLQWGYNLDKYSKSDIHLKDGDHYDFTIVGATATDKPDFDGLLTNPLQFTIPQYSYRIGIYTNKERTEALEFNYDHTKYVMRDNQFLRIKGTMHGEPFDRDTVITRDFVHFEHTNGANFYHINYVRCFNFLDNKKKDRKLLSVVAKGGAGVVIPKTDVTIMGKQLDNRFHVAGYVISAESGIRYYPTRKLFLELTGKGGFANYTNVLTIGNGRANHHFWYGEVIGLIGYDIWFKRKAKTPAHAD